MTDKAALSGLMTPPALLRPYADQAIHLARDFAFRDAERKRDPAGAGLATTRLGVYLPSGSHGAWDTPFWTKTLLSAWNAGSPVSSAKRTPLKMPLGCELTAETVVRPLEDPDYWALAGGDGRL
jgi:hypothetical protein